MRARLSPGSAPPISSTPGTTSPLSHASGSLPYCRTLNLLLVWRRRERYVIVGQRVQEVGLLHKRGDVQHLQLADRPVEYTCACMPGESRLEQEAVRLRHACVGGSRQRTARRVVSVVSYRRRSTNTDRSVPSQINRIERLGRADRYDKSRLNIQARDFAAPAPCEPIAGEGFPKSTDDSFGYIEDGIAPGRIAEAAWRRDGIKRTRTVAAMDQTVYPAEPYRMKALANAMGIVLGGHAKSPWASPSAAAATRSLSPLPRRTIGFAPLRDGRGVVSQIQAV